MPNPCRYQDYDRSMLYPAQYGSVFHGAHRAPSHPLYNHSPASMFRDSDTSPCKKSLRSSYTGLYPPIFQESSNLPEILQSARNPSTPQESSNLQQILLPILTPARQQPGVMPEDNGLLSSSSCTLAPAPRSHYEEILIRITIATDKHH